VGGSVVRSIEGGGARRRGRRLLVPSLPFATLARSRTQTHFRAHTRCVGHALPTLCSSPPPHRRRRRHLGQVDAACRAGALLESWPSTGVPPPEEATGQLLDHLDRQGLGREQAAAASAAAFLPVAAATRLVPPSRAFLRLPARGGGGGAVGGGAGLAPYAFELPAALQGGGRLELLRSIGVRDEPTARDLVGGRRRGAALDERPPSGARRNLVRVRVRVRVRLVGRGPALLASRVRSGCGPPHTGPLRADLEPLSHPPPPPRLLRLRSRRCGRSAASWRAAA
jgi:hypothetical protein